ncbi:Penicillin-binding protein 2 [Bibersteinia trehalosi USDA-ARS-USMARC-190]|nr:Penicillin-binding protein 2 [Bibersteinia trehalosi USDA-ARS-USMARC-190]
MPYQDPKLYDDIQGVPQRFWQISKLGMYNVNHASNGTGRKAFAGAFYKSAGKTGTAQVFSLKGKDYNKNTIAKKLHDHGWFIGYAPYENPKMVISVILENAGGGGSTAAPMARKVMDYTLRHLNDQPNLQNNSENQPLATESDSE